MTLAPAGAPTITPVRRRVRGLGHVCAGGPSHPIEGDDRTPDGAQYETSTESMSNVGLRIDERKMTARTYEITFAGEAVPAVVSAFEDFDVVVGDGRTTLRAQLSDQAALHGTLIRVRSLALELLEVRAVD